MGKLTKKIENYLGNHALSIIMLIALICLQLLVAKLAANNYQTFSGTLLAKVISFEEKSRSGVAIVQLKMLQQGKIKNIFSSNLRCQYNSLPWVNQIPFGRGHLVAVKLSVRRALSFKTKTWWNSLRDQVTPRQICKIHAIAIIKENKNSFLNSVRQKLALQVSQTLGDSELTGVILGMSLGFRGAISAELEALLKKSGLMHLMIVSGFQVSLVFGLLYGFFSLLLGSSAYLLDTGKLRIIIPLLAWGCSFCFVSLCDFDPAALRALISISIFVLARLAGLSVTMPALLIASIFFVTLTQPLSFLTASFHLSFAALFGIALGASLSEENKLRSYLLVNLFASLFTAIVSWLWFGQFSFWGLLFNPILAPILGLIGCPVALVCIIFSFLGFDTALRILGFFFSQLIELVSLVNL